MAVNVAEPPEQIVALFTVTDELGLTVTVIEVEKVCGNKQLPELLVKSV